MPTAYTQSVEVKAIVTASVEDASLTEFEALRNADIDIGCLLRQKTDANDQLVESGKPVELKKVPTYLEPLMESKYVIILDQAVWQDADQNRRRALLHKALMGVEVTESGGFKTKKPEINEFRATVTRFGAYNESLSNLQQLLTSGARRAVQAVRPATDATPAPAPATRRRRRSASAPVIADGEET